MSNDTMTEETTSEEPSIESKPVLNGINPDRLAGREYKVTLSYTVEYEVTVTAGPTDEHAVNEAKVVANPSGDITPSDYELIHSDVEVLEDIWMDDVKAPRAAAWLDEPHTPSEHTFWDDTQHFDSIEPNTDK